MSAGEVAERLQILAVLKADIRQKHVGNMAVDQPWRQFAHFPDADINLCLHGPRRDGAHRLIGFTRLQYCKDFDWLLHHVPRHAPSSRSSPVSVALNDG